MSVYNQMFEHRGFSNTQKLILDRIVPERTILELGPASGYMTRVLKEEKKCLVDAIELDPESGAQARPYCRTMIIGSLDAARILEKLPGNYDFIIAADVLEHLKAPEQLLQALKPLLKPNGCLMVSLPNVAYWKIRLQLLLGRFEYTESGILDRTHLHFFTRASAARMIQDAGYRLVQVLSAEPDRPAFGRLKSQLKQKLATLFSGNFIFLAEPEASK